MALIGLLVLSACSSGTLGAETVTSTVGATGGVSGSSSSSDSSSSQASTTREVPPVATVAATPAFGTQGLSPIEPLTLVVDKGTIDDVSMTNPDGKVVAATIAADRKSWTVAEPLGFGKTYTVTGTATGTDGKQVPIQGTWDTVSADTQTRNTINPGDNVEVGVAAPISVSFGAEPQDREAVAKRISITTTPAVEGAWAWVKHDDSRWALDFRTKDYWPAGTKVHVDAKLYGVKLDDTSYGAADITSDFTIGRNQVVVADVNSHELVVKQNDQVVASYPASFGRGSDNGDPELVTRSGIHVVTEKAQDYLMNNPRYGYTNSLQHWTVRISNNGEFIHANPASADAQGNSNVTHGCVNLSMADAETYYNSAIWGDPVEVSGTNVQLSAMDGDIYIWGLSWDEWKAMSVPVGTA
ncbi:ErfK/YbiS/YcfS/YnhG family protein [Nakamurella multipartita DSM 44233]|uniref:ErfK/YbiS/YcfS/YnhG family protein n=2 Tax=Nakamurella TaxID=53460 RepID=C8XFY5_NAKMY|nr:ErfK/YbiS/YcfS/YnhG family protein [Nakamurella multipartita DSM 44233]